MVIEILKVSTLGNRLERFWGDRFGCLTIVLVDALGFGFLALYRLRLFDAIWDIFE